MKIIFSKNKMSVVGKNFGFATEHSAFVARQNLFKTFLFSECKFILNNQGCGSDSDSDSGISRNVLILKGFYQYFSAKLESILFFDAN